MAISSSDSRRRTDAAWARLASATAWALVVGCGGAAPAEVGRSDPRSTSGPVDLTLLDMDGNVVEVRDFRGRHVVLYLFATFDGGSQLALTPLSRFVESHPDVVVVGIAVQPSARSLADAWVAALEPPFPVTWEPGETITEGTSDLGDLEGIPTFIGLDPEGRVAGRHVGVPSGRELDELVER